MHAIAVVQDSIPRATTQQTWLDGSHDLVPQTIWEPPASALTPASMEPPLEEPLPLEEPDAPEEPDEPEDPDAPDEPDAPGEPDAPEEPDEPEDPDAPGEPDAPDDTGEPDEPEIPEELPLAELPSGEVLTLESPDPLQPAVVAIPTEMDMAANFRRADIRTPPRIK
jgi:hypothetical protein